MASLFHAHIEYLVEHICSRVVFAGRQVMLLEAPDAAALMRAGLILTHEGVVCDAPYTGTGQFLIRVQVPA